MSGGGTAWAKAKTDEPLEKNVTSSLVLATNYTMTRCKYDRASMWADLDKKSLRLEDERIDVLGGTSAIQ